MTRYLIAGLALALVLALWRVDHVTADRATAVAQRDAAVAAVASLRATLRLQRALAADLVAIETTHLMEKRDAEDEAERLRRCLADGSCGLRVAATCVRVDGPATATGEPDAGTPELTAAARSAYPALVTGLQQQRAQIIGLQRALTALHGECRIGGQLQQR